MKNTNRKNKIVSLAMATIMMGSVLMPLTEIKVNAQENPPAPIENQLNEENSGKERVYRKITEDRPEKEFPIKDNSVEWTTADFEISNGFVNSFSSQGYEKFNRNPENIVVKIPAKDKDGKPVTTIAKDAFKYDKTKFKHFMQFVDLPDTITNIKEEAFYNQDLNFEEFTIPNTWVEVDKYAFSGAYFKKLILTNMNKNFNNIYWNGITTPYVEMNGMGEWQMNDMFFRDSNIKYVNYGNSKIKLSESSFSNVNNKSNNKNQAYKTFKITWDDQKTGADFDVPEWEKDIPSYAFDNCKSLQSVTFENLPAFQSVGDNAFSDCGALQSVTFENLPQFQSVGNNAFHYCKSLQSVTFENLPAFQMVRIGAFDNCKSLQSVTFENLPAFQSVGDNAFSDCGALQSVTFENLPQFQSVGNNAFSCCKSLQSVTFKDLPNFEKISNGNWNVYNKTYGGVFIQCKSLQSVTFENLPAFQSVGRFAFMDCDALQSVTFKDAYVTSINKEAFANTPLKNLKFIESEENLDRTLSVDVDAFRNCNITKLELPKRYNKDTGSGFINQKFTRTLTNEDFKEDPNYKLVRGEGNANPYVTITNPISIKHGDNQAYLGSVEANPYVEIINGPNGEPNMILKIKGNTALGETYNATWSNNKLQIDDVAGTKGDIPFTGSVSLALAFEDLGEVHLMKDNWKYDPIETIEALRNSNFPTDKVLASIKTSSDSKVKDTDIDRKVIFASVDMTKPADTVQNAVVRVFFKDGTTTDVEVPVKLTQTDADKFVTDVENKKLVATPEIVKQYDEYDLTDNFGKLPEGITIVETSKKINTSFIGDYEATVDIINKNGKDLKGVKVPVKVVPLDADNANIKTKEIVKEQGKGDNVDLTEGIVGYNLLNIQEVETLIPVTDEKVGRFNGKLKLTFKDKSTAFIYAPVEITEKKIEFNAKTHKIQVFKDYVVTNGMLRDAFENLPANAEVIDLTNPPVDTSTIGEKNAKVKVILKDGRESEHVVLLEVIDPIGELEKQIEKDNEKIKTITENNEKLVKEIEKLQNQINELVIKINQAEADKIELQNQINTLTIEKNKLEILVQSNDELIKELREHIKTLKAQVLDLQKTIKNKDAEIAKLLEKIGKLETSIETLTKENTDLKEKLATATEKIANLEAKIKDLEGQVKDLTDEVNTKTEEINTLKDKIAELEVEVAKLTESGKAKDAEIERLKAEIEDLKAQLKDKTDQIEKLTEEINTLKEKLAQSEAKNSELEKQIEKLEKEVKDLKETITDLNNKVTTLETENEDLKKAIEDEKEKNKDLTDKVNDLTDKNKDLEDKINTTEEKNKDLENKINDLEYQKKDLEDKLEAEKAKDNKDEEKIKDLEEKINDKEKDINDLSKDKKDLEDKIKELNKEKEELRKLIDELNKKIQENSGSKDNKDKNNPTNNNNTNNNNVNVNIDNRENDNIFEREYRRRNDDRRYYRESERLPFEIVYEREVPRYTVPVQQNYEQRLEYIFTIGSTVYQRIMGANVENRSMDVAPYIKNNRTMLPLRYVAEAIGAEVRWDNATRTAYFTKDGITAKIQIEGNKIEMSDGRIITMDSKPDNIKGRIFVSLTNVSKVFNLTNGNTADGINQQIEWNNNNRTVSISLDR